MSTSMRTNEYKLRQKEIGNPYLSDEQKRSIRQLLKQTRRSIKEISGDGAYDTRECHWAIRVNKM